VLFHTLTYRYTLPAFASLLVLVGRRVKVMVDSSAIDRIDFDIVWDGRICPENCARSLVRPGSRCWRMQELMMRKLLQRFTRVTADFELSRSRSKKKQGYCLPELHGQRGFTPLWSGNTRKTQLPSGSSRRVLACGKP
jgi:hypothetical protein